MLVVFESSETVYMNSLIRFITVTAVPVCGVCMYAEQRTGLGTGLGYLADSVWE